MIVRSPQLMLARWHPLIQATRTRLRGLISPSQSVWRRHLPDEVKFWDDWFRTRGLQWPDEYRLRLDPAAPLQEIVARVLPGPRVLDVGAGSLTWLGKVFQGAALDITPVDPLAKHYDDLLARYGITPPVRTVAGEAESLERQFAPDSFDMAFARNSIDHAYDPARAILSMLSVVRPGGLVVLWHKVKEGFEEGYEGLHQWDFALQGEVLRISSPGRRTVDVNRLISPCALKARAEPEGWLWVEIWKTGC